MIKQFPNSNTFVRLEQSVRAKDVFVIQPTSAPVNDNLMELLIFIDTLRRDSAGRITAVVPYYGYGRTDKKDQPRVPITARLVADLIAAAGRRPLRHARPARQADPGLLLDSDATSCPRWACSSSISGRIRSRTRSSCRRTSARCAGRATSPRTLDLPLAVIEKRRSLDGVKTEIWNLIGDVRDKNVIIVDDEIDTARHPRQGGQLHQGAGRAGCVRLRDARRLLRAGA